MWKINSETVKGIADAIRYAEGSSGKISVTDFAKRIRALSGGQPIPPTPVRPDVPQTGTWQYKTTPTKKYVILGTDDDNNGNTKFLRLLRTYGFPYTMNVMSEKVHNMVGSDIDDMFTAEDAPSLFPNNTSVLDLGLYINEHNLGEVAQHGDEFLWDSRKLTDSVWNDLYSTYTSGGGTKTLSEFKVALLETFKAHDVAQGASYVSNSRQILEDAYGFFIDTVGIWGGALRKNIDDVLITIPNAVWGSYNFRNDNYTASGTDLNIETVNNHNPYELSREGTSLDVALNHIKNVMRPSDIQEFYWHKPFNDIPDISSWRSFMSELKTLVDNNEVEVITRKHYPTLGEFVDNPIVSVSASTKEISYEVGSILTDEDFICKATLLDGSEVVMENDRILDYSSVNTSQEGQYTISVAYRGFYGNGNVLIQADIPTEYILENKNYSGIGLVNNTEICDEVINIESGKKYRFSFNFKAINTTNYSTHYIILSGANGFASGDSVQINTTQGLTNTSVTLDITSARTRQLEKLFKPTKVQNTNVESWEITNLYCWEVTE